MQQKNSRVKTKAGSLSFTTTAGTKVKAVSSKSKIGSKEAYDATMEEINALMKKGEENLSDAQLRRLRVMAEAAEMYEDMHEPLPVPSTLPDIIKIKLFQMRIKQNFAAKLLGVSDAKFSMIMNGNQKPDIFFIKAVHEKLKVDANDLLKAIA